MRWRVSTPRSSTNSATSPRTSWKASTHGADRPQPCGLLRILLRIPIWLYRARLGWLAGHRLLYLAHGGRRTGARCVEYLAERGFGKIVKSACVGCPFHGNAGWRWIRDHDPGGWAEAVAFDRAIRHGYPHATEQGQELRGQHFLHRSCQPLDPVDLDTPARTTNLTSPTSHRC